MLLKKIYLYSVTARKQFANFIQNANFRYLVTALKALVRSPAWVKLMVASFVQRSSVPTIRKAAAALPRCTWGRHFKNCSKICNIYFLIQNYNTNMVFDKQGLRQDNF